MKLQDVLLEYVFRYLLNKYPNNHIIKSRSSRYLNDNDLVILRIKKRSHIFEIGDVITICGPNDRMYIKYHGSATYVALNPQDINIFKHIDNHIESSLKQYSNGKPKLSRKTLFGQDISNLTLQRKNAKHSRPKQGD